MRAGGSLDGGGRDGEEGTCLELRIGGDRTKRTETGEEGVGRLDCVLANPGYSTSCKCLFPQSKFGNQGVPLNNGVKIKLISIDPIIQQFSECSKKQVEESGYALPEDFIHLEHINLIRVEDRSEKIIAENFPLVTRVLEVVLLDILPQLLHHLRPG